MNRRSVLTSLGVGMAGLGGCQLAGSTAGSTTGTPVPTPTACDGSVTREITIGETATLPSSAGLSIDVSMLRERSTSEETARLEVAITNEGSRRTIDIGGDSRCHILNRDAGRSEPRGVWLYWIEDTPSDRVGECWTRDATPAIDPGFNGYGCPRNPLSSGDTVSTTYEVWNDYTERDYLPPGQYRFAETIPIWEGEDDDDPDVYDWWLDLEITAPES